MNLFKRTSANKCCSPTCLLLHYIMWFNDSWYQIGYGCDIVGGLMALLHFLEETRKEVQKNQNSQNPKGIYIGKGCIRKGLLFYSVCPILPCNFCAPKLLTCLVYLTNCSTDVQGKLLLAAKDWQPNAHILKASMWGRSQAAADLYANYSPLQIHTPTRTAAKGCIKV